MHQPSAVIIVLVRTGNGKPSPFEPLRHQPNRTVAYGRDRTGVEVVVVIMADQHQVDWGQLRDLHCRRTISLGPHHLDRGRPLREYGVCQDVEAIHLRGVSMGW